MNQRRSKRGFSQAELRNDPSLKWCEYRFGEMLWSDIHQTEVRFARYEEELVRVCSLNGIEELPDLVSSVWVRRPSVMSKEENMPMEAKRFKVFEIAESRK